jgi:hypothetical protein
MASNPEIMTGAVANAPVDPNAEPVLISVWGETVKTRNLCLALLISVPSTLIGLLVAEKILAGVMEDGEIAKTYSLLIGLAIVVTTAVISARMFRPQRIVTTGDAGQSTTFEEALEELAEGEGGLGHTDLVPAYVQQEMRSLRLHDAFVEAERRATVPDLSAAPDQTALDKPAPGHTERSQSAPDPSGKR